MKIEIRKLAEKEKKALGIDSWGVWEKEISDFLWEYGEKESCYILVA